jgi:hypothetical protein
MEEGLGMHGQCHAPSWLIVDPHGQLQFRSLMSVVPGARLCKA